MQKENQSFVNNNIEVIGTICGSAEFSHEVYGEGFYSFKVEVLRLSESSDYLPVTISERLIDKDSLKEGMLVHIKGQIRSYNSYTQEEQKNKLILTIFARDIEIIEDYEEVRYINPNEVFLNGFICKPTIFRTTPFGREISDMLLAVNRSYNKSDYIPCISWGRNAKFVSTLDVGDNIKITGRMQSRIYQKKTENGEVLEKTAYEISVSKIERVFNEDVEEVEEINNLQEESSEESI